jgi:hypothetical protein
MELRPMFFTRIWIVVSSPGTNSLFPLNVAVKEGPFPRYRVAAEAGATVRILHMSRVKITIAVPAEPGQLVRVMWITHRFCMFSVIVIITIFPVTIFPGFFRAVRALCPLAIINVH